MRWRENGDKVERARVRTEPRSKWARRPVKERDYACRRVSTVQGASQHSGEEGVSSSSPCCRDTEEERAQENKGPLGAFGRIILWWGV